MDRSIEETARRLELIESKLQWLFENTDLTSMLFEYDITISKQNEIADMLQSYRDRLSAGESISRANYESKMQETSGVPDYHFAESYLANCYKEGRWEELFEAFYKGCSIYERTVKELQR